MNIKNTFYHYKNIFVIISFFILSVLSTALLVHTHILGGGSDTYMHWQRIMELKNSFSYYHFFPKVALNEFYGNGSAMMSFYPYLNILPIVFLSYIIKSNINLIYFSFSLYTFITLLISYYSALHINHRIDTSYVFSILYSLSAFMAYNGFQTMDLGILTSSVFLPLVIFGFVDFIKRNHWLELSLGITLIIFSHVLNSVFILLFLFIWLVINIKKIDHSKMISLIKASLLSLLTTSIFYVPMLKLMLLNKINNFESFQLGGTSFLDLINNSFNNNVNYTPGIFAILGAFLIPLLFYRHFNNFIKQSYWLSILVLILCSNIFPWSLFQNSFINIIQFPWRFYFIPQFLLTYIFSLGITKYLSKQIAKKYILTGVILFAVLLQFSAQNQLINQHKNAKPLDYNVINDLMIPAYGQYKMVNSQQVNNLSFGFSSSDYYPKASMVWLDQLRNNQGIYDINKYLQFYSLGNGVSAFYNHNKINELNVPFVGYRGIKYQAYLDNHPVPFKVNKTKLFTLNNVQKGKHYIKIKTIPNISDIIVRILFFIGILIYLWLFFIKYFNKYKLLK